LASNVLDGTMERNFHRRLMQEEVGFGDNGRCISYGRMEKTMADEVIANQKTILQNQKSILANQKAILTNQAAIRKNQKALNAILTNQKEILRNQKAILGAVKK
jgi:hypothetical protein